MLKHLVVRVTSCSPVTKKEPIFYGQLEFLINWSAAVKKEYSEAPPQYSEAPPHPHPRFHQSHPAFPTFTLSTAFSRDD